MNEFLKNINLTEIVASVFVAVIAFIVWEFIKKVRDRYEEKNKGKQTVSTVHFVFGALRIVIIACAVIIILQIFGINVTSAVAGLGIASAIVGLALQDLLKDVIMGIHIISDGFFTIGDGVEYQGAEGVVKEFSLKSTKIEVLEDHSIISVCNRNIDQIKKYSQIVDIDIPLSYGEDTKKVFTVLDSISKTIAGTDGVQKCTFEGVQRFDASAVVYRIDLYCNPVYRVVLRRKALKIIFDGLQNEGIAIPFNQLDVHLEKE